MSPALAAFATRGELRPLSCPVPAPGVAAAAVAPEPGPPAAPAPQSPSRSRPLTAPGGRRSGRGCAGAGARGMRAAGAHGRWREAEAARRGGTGRRAGGAAGPRACSARLLCDVCRPSVSLPLVLFCLGVFGDRLGAPRSPARQPLLGAGTAALGVRRARRPPHHPGGTALRTATHAAARLTWQRPCFRDALFSNRLSFFFLFIYFIFLCSLKWGVAIPTDSWRLKWECGA